MLLGRWLPGGNTVAHTRYERRCIDTGELRADLEMYQGVGTWWLGSIYTPSSSDSAPEMTTVWETHRRTTREEAQADVDAELIRRGDTAWDPTLVLSPVESDPGNRMDDHDWVYTYRISLGR